MRLLLVEDNFAVGLALAKALRTRGYAVTLTRSCAEADAASGVYDVGIFDLTLPDGDGIALCERLLAARRVARALFSSASVDDLLLERAQRTAPVVSKAASIGELCAAIDSRETSAGR